MLHLINENSNTYQFWKRKKEECQGALRDLTLIACKSPDDKLQQIFNEGTLKELLFALFYEDRSDPQNPIKIRSADLQLASLFAAMSIDACIREYEKWNKETPESSKPTIDRLKESIAICKEIGYKYRINMMEKESSENNLKFICIWEEINHKHKDRFYAYVKEYVVEKMRIQDPIELYCSINKESKKEFSIIDLASDEEDRYLGKVTVNVQPPFNKGEIKFYNENNEEIGGRNITLKKFNSQTALYY